MMTFKQNSLKWAFLLVSYISVVRYCEALASKAVYVIENLGSKQCLSAGGMTRTEDMNSSSIALIKHGHVISKPCSDFNFLNTTDFSQQWLVRIQKENSRNFAYQIQLAMLNTLYHDINLTAELRGEFIIYFPDKLYLRSHHLPDGNFQSHIFVISDPATDTCLTDSDNGIEFVKCNDSDNLENWNFTIVNEKLISPDFYNATQL